jgi:hypothetical protein
MRHRNDRNLAFLNSPDLVCFFCFLRQDGSRFRTETVAEKAAFLADVKTVTGELGFSPEEAQALISEHATWTSIGWTLQHNRLTHGRGPIASTPDMSADLVADDSLKTLAASTCPMTHLLLVVVVSAALTTVEGERGFSLMKLVLTSARSRLTEAQVSHLMMVSLHAPTSLFEVNKFLREVAQLFLSKKNRRLTSPNYNNDPTKKPVTLGYKRQSTSRPGSSFTFFKPRETLPLPPPVDAVSPLDQPADDVSGVQSSAPNAGIDRSPNASFFSGDAVGLPLSPSDPMGGRKFSIIDLGQFLAARPVDYPSSGFFLRLWNVLGLPGTGGSSLCAVLHLLYAICILLKLVLPADLIQRAATEGSPVRVCLRDLLSSHHQRLITEVWVDLEEALELKESAVMHTFSLDLNSGALLATGGTGLLDQDAEGWARQAARVFVVRTGVHALAGHFILATPNPEQLIEVLLLFTSLHEFYVVHVSTTLTARVCTL